MKWPHARRSSQQGAIIVMVALALVVMLGFLGLIVDLGRMFIIKTELQNATDACALAAARELTCSASAVGGTCPGTFLQNAEAAGIAVGNRNLVDLQSTNAALGPDNISFSTVLSGSGGSDSVYQTIAGGASPNSQYVMCSLPQTGIVMYFMRLLGFGPQTVNAMAVATLSPSVTSCAIPLGVCQGPNSQGASNDYGLTVGQWLTGLYAPGGPNTGSYNWIDFTPPSGGANELYAMLTGTGECNLPPVGTLVGQQGQLTALSKYWNTRFGLYTSNLTPSSAQPDKTGIAYTASSTSGANSFTWPCAFNAYGGNASTCVDAAGDKATASNFVTSQAPSLPYQPSNPMGLGNNYANMLPSPLAGNRRIAVAPIIDCSLLTGSNPQSTPVQGYACVLMLNPITDKNGAGAVSVEFEGLSNTPGNPCATTGLPGGSFGPMVPTLVQ
jgi:hypothetical protein